MTDSHSDSQVQVARINAIQAIIVAVITASATLGAVYLAGFRPSQNAGDNDELVAVKVDRDRLTLTVESLQAQLALKQSELQATKQIVFSLQAQLEDTGAKGQLRQMLVQVKPRETVLTAGGSTSIQVQVLSGPNAPIAGADVEINVGGGSFRGSGNRVSKGKTNPHGFFSDTWASPPSAAGISYLVTARVEKEGFVSASKQVELKVRR